jgi:hypothetical protein
MDEFSTASDNLDQTDEEILTPTVLDEALEAAADCVAGNEPSLFLCDYPYSYSRNCPE